MTALNIPNLLTIVRILIIPAFIMMIIYSKYRHALSLFIAAAITDVLDGLIARLKNQKTTLGMFLDPLADKFLLVSSFIVFSVYGLVPKWLTIIIISRDLIVVVGWLLLYMITQNLRVEPLFLGKAAIAVQFLLLTYILISVNFPTLAQIPDSALYLTAFLSAVSGLHYIYRGVQLNHAS